MARTHNKTGWLTNFRRAIGHTRNHLKPLLLGLLAAVGVSVFYTGSISGVIPALKVLFSEYETLTDWLQRTEAERRLGVAFPADLPTDPNGIEIVNVRQGTGDYDNSDTLTRDDWIVGIAGERLNSSEIIRRLATAESETLVCTIAADNGETRTLSLALKPYRSYWRKLQQVAELLPDDRRKALVALMAAICVVSILSALFRFINESLVAVAVQRTMHDLRAKTAAHVLRLPVPWHNSRPVGDTLGRFSNDLNRVETGIWTVFGKTVREPLKAVGVLALTIAIDWRIIVIAIIGLPIAAFIIRTFGKMVKRAQKRASKSWGVLLDHLDERLAGIRVVKAYNMEAEESDRFEEEGRRLMKAQTSIEIADAAIKPTLETLATLAITGFIIYGGFRVFNHEIDRQAFFGAVICLGGLFDPIRKLGNVNNRIQSADAAAARVFELIDTPTEEDVVHEDELPTLAPFSDKIEIKNLTFTYPGTSDSPVLRDVNLTVKKGQVVAVVGPNGSGKTTLISLLLRFFEPQKGKILIDGKDIAEVSLHSLRDHFGLVTQDAVIFSGSARDNIAYGADGVTDEQIQKAARLAHLDEFLEDLHRGNNGKLKHGFDAEVNANQLSGGQRQRFAIARAILRDPAIFILDEATSQVDSASEQKIQQALEDVTQNRTTFIIAHRFSTIRKADLIVCLNDGEIVGMGRHEDLFQECPVYHGLCQTQFAHGNQQ